MNPTRRLIACALVALTLTVTACAPTGMLLGFGDAGGESSTDCRTAIDQLWPGGLQPRAHRIMWRESRNSPTAQNRRSTAAGCFQLLRTHAGRFAKLGFDWNHDRYDPWVNTAVAYDLYRSAGWSPWY